MIDTTTQTSDEVDAIIERMFAHVRPKNRFVAAWYRAVGIVEGIFRDTRNLIRNLIFWTPVIRHYQWWESQYIIIILERALTDMAERTARDGYHVSSLANARQQEICVYLCRRIIDDKYYKQRDYFTGQRYTKRLIQPDRKLQDWRYLCHLLGRHMLTWWE